MRRLAALCAAAVVLAQTASAQDVDCTNAQTQMEMTFCAEQDWQAADADLNAAYKAAQEVMRAIDAELPKAERGAEANLRDGQRAWVTFRDATCAAEGYAMHGGSAEAMLIYSCRARLTEQRGADLWTMATPY
mgnify:FL=1